MPGNGVFTPLLRRRTTRKSKGIALAQFESAADAVAAQAALDRSVFQGRLLHILPGQRPPPAPAAAVSRSSQDRPLDILISLAGRGHGHGHADFLLGVNAAFQVLQVRPPFRVHCLAKQGKAGSGVDDFKSARAAQRREEAGNRPTWNSLFMRQDTVAEAVAAHYGVTKARSSALGALHLKLYRVRCPWLLWGL